MSTIASTILICAPLAFIAGWVISKVLLQQDLADRVALTENPVTPQEFDPNATIQRPDGRDLLAKALEHANERESQVSEAGQQTASLRNELRVIKEALAERDHEIDELRAKLRDQPDPLAIGAPGNAQDDSATAELRERLEAVDHERLLLSGEVHRAEALTDRKHRHVATWRNRARALVRQCRQQRIIIGELRSQLKTDNQTGDATGMPLPVEVPSDDLKVLRGIGPALEKRLNQQGIFCYRQIAAMSVEELMELGGLLGIGKQRTLSSEWLEQAQALVQGDNSNEPVDAPEAEPALPA